jgi:hypothetical protein
MPPADNPHRDELLRESAASIERQRWIEANDQMPFEEYLAQYYS